MLQRGLRVIAGLMMLLFGLAVSPGVFGDSSNNNLPSSYEPDCNDPDVYDFNCLEPTQAIIQQAYNSGYPYYIGHDEPALLFFSSAGTSGSNMQWKLQLPATEASPTQNGTRVANFELYPEFWISLDLCDPNSNPFNTCLPVSDSNDPSIAGAAFLELQFYPPGLNCSSDSQWCVNLHINTLENNNAYQIANCMEPTTQAYVTTDGTLAGPKLLMSNGDSILVTIHDTPSGLETDVNDLTSSTTGSMVASGANGFVHNSDNSTCTTAPFDFHAMYSTASSSHIVPWASLKPDVAFAGEIGHFELCGNSDCSTLPDVDGDDTNCFTVRGVGGCFGRDTDFDGTSYQADWPDGTANHPASILIGSSNDNGVGPMSKTGTINYDQGYNKIKFSTTVNTTGISFYPFYSQAGTGSSCRFNFGNDIPGITTNDFGKTSQYGTTIDNPCLPGTFSFQEGTFTKQPTDSTQFSRPASDNSTGGWTPIPLYPQLNEATPDDTTYVTSPSGTAPQFQVKLSNVSPPITNTGLLIKFRAEAPGGSGPAEKANAVLFQGSTQIAQTGLQTLSRTSFTQFQYALTSAEAASITDYTNLSIVIQTSKGNTEVIRVSWIEFDVPPPVTIQSVTGLNFKPKALILFTTSQSSQGTTDVYNNGIGFSDGINSRSISVASDDNVSPSNSGRAFGSKIITILNSGTPTITAQADLDSFDASGFTLKWTTNDASVPIIHYIALRDSQLTNVTVSSFAARTIPGNQAVTGLTFQPDFVMFMHAASTSDTSASTNGYLSYGFAKSASSRAALAFDSVDNSKQGGNTHEIQRTDLALVGLNPATAAINAQADLVSMNPTGFTLNWIQAPITADKVYYLALKGGSYDIGSFDKTTQSAPVTQTIQGKGFVPRGLILTSFDNLANTAVQSNNRISLGATDGSSKSTIWAGDQNGAKPTITASSTTTSKTIRMATEAAIGSSSTINAEANIISMNYTDFTLNWSTNDAIAKQLIYVQMGDKPSGTIKIVEHTSPSDSTQFQFTSSTLSPSPFTLYDNNTGHNSTNFVNLLAGTYDVLETANSNFVTTSSCSNGNPINTITVKPGDTITCTVTNTGHTFFENFDNPLSGWSLYNAFTTCCGPPLLDQITSAFGFPPPSPPYWGEVHALVNDGCVSNAFVDFQKNFTVNTPGNYNVSATTGSDSCNDCIISGQVLIDHNLVLEQDGGDQAIGTISTIASPSAVINIPTAGTHAVDIAMHSTLMCSGDFASYFDNVKVQQTSSPVTPIPVGGPYFNVTLDQQSANVTRPSSVTVPLDVNWYQGWNAQPLSILFANLTNTNIGTTVTSIENTTSYQEFNVTFNIPTNVIAGNYTIPITVWQKGTDDTVATPFILHVR